MNKNPEMFFKFIKEKYPIMFKSLLFIMLAVIL